MYTEKETQFYPTPESLVSKVSRLIQHREDGKGLAVLEPSAGKGDLLKALKMRNCKCSIVDCCEIDKNLQSILKSKHYNVVGYDFLQLNSYTQYDLIIMNPPFSDGDKHLLKAMEMQKNGGQVICILNAETLKNPCTVYRQDLLQKLTDYNASIEYVDNAFSHAERKTDVEIAIVNVVIPRVEYTMDMFNNLIAGDEFKETYGAYNNAQLATNNTISNVLKQYNDECRMGLTLIDTFEKMSSIIPGYDDRKESSGIIRISIISSEKDDSMSQKNLFIRQLRFKYWNILFQTKELSKLFTERVRAQFSMRIQEMRSFDFTAENIRRLYAELSADLSSNIEEAILYQFDNLSYQNSMDKNSNIHYYNGWKTNSAYRINKKVIIPCYGLHERWYWSFYNARDILCELEKIFTYLDGGKEDGKNMDTILYELNSHEYNGERIHAKYFDIEFKKKGTIHIWFTNEELLKKFNIFGANKKGWLPNDYGKKKYSDMSKEEQDVVQSFEGVKQYEDTCNNSRFYFGGVQLPAIGMSE
jgi:predicted RNA methylase